MVVDRVPCANKKSEEPAGKENDEIQENIEYGLKEQVNANIRKESSATYVIVLYCRSLKLHSMVRKIVK